MGGEGAGGGCREEIWDQCIGSFVKSRSTLDYGAMIVGNLFTIRFFS